MTIVVAASAAQMIAKLSAKLSTQRRSRIVLEVRENKPCRAVVLPRKRVSGRLGASQLLRRHAGRRLSDAIPLSRGASVADRAHHPHDPACRLKRNLRDFQRRNIDDRPVTGRMVRERAPGIEHASLPLDGVRENMRVAVAHQIVIAGMNRMPEQFDVVAVQKGNAASRDFQRSKVLVERVVWLGDGLARVRLGSSMLP